MWLVAALTACGGADADGDGFSVEDGDCDDTDVAVAPGSDETCDGVDQDCNGVVDDAPADGVEYYVDDDGDGFGDDERSQLACAAPDGYAADAGDCDDSNDAVNPDADDLPNRDRNCDDVVDGGGGTVTGDQPPTVDVRWDANGVTVEISDGDPRIDTWAFGMAETGAASFNWYAEDCVDGSSYGLDVCHYLDADGGRIVSVAIDEVDDGRTLFTAGSEDNLTYVLFDGNAVDTVVCWTWGDDPSYYTDGGCRLLP